MNGWQRRLVFILIMANVVVHYGDMPSWIPTLGLLFVGWRWVADLYHRIPCPGRVGAAIFAVVATVGVWAEFSRLIGDPASTALLIIMVALKTFEIRGYRDLMIVTYLCLLLLMAKLLSSQTLGITIFMFADVTTILALMHLYHLPERQGGVPWRRAGRLLLQAVPVLAALFFLFPRFNFSLFQRATEPASRMGFSGHIRPGSVAQLAQSDQVAFRAFFRTGYQPPASRLYWRGAVLEQSNGLNWDPSTVRRKLETKIPGENVVEIMMEAGDANWLFTLDWPLHMVMGSSLRQEQVEESAGLSYSLKTPLMERETYAVSFTTAPREINWDTTEAERSLQVAKPGWRLRELLSAWQSHKGKPQEALKVIQDYLVTQKFAYTLTPPEIDDLDEFLFQTKSGFCEHFAGAVASLLRHLNVPARVIVGYHGGSPSLMNDYLLVYQRYALAWVVFWYKTRQHWVILDPTRWVAADRAISTAPGFEAWQNNPLAKWLGPEFASFLVRGRLAVDQAEILWITMLLRYDFNYQREMFARWGLGAITRGLLFGLSLAAVVILGLLFYAAIRLGARRRVEPEVELYRMLCQRLEKAGLKRAANEGPLELLKRAKSQWPSQGPILEELFGFWIALRYGQERFSEKAAGAWRQRLRKLTLQTDAGAQQD
ncbi:MAG: DUF3488 and DUF4129 domain-containing transglutaminase family protein [Bdellovibrionales bacterium]